MFAKLIFVILLLQLILKKENKLVDAQWQLNVDKNASTVSWDRLLHHTKPPRPLPNNNPENKSESDCEKKGSKQPPIEFIQGGI
ncbi:unnamed protein product [Meloidogyne enterolobii]|uniref:Uncharacterized protein n=1 Tax=Meloidogyne enterolobii TaxID=390850 RepID=A0ACB1AKJ4_MELEN